MCKIRRFGRGILAVIVWSMLSSGMSSAVAEDFSENQLKAAFLINFFHFLTWPDGIFADSHAPFRLCVLGENPFQQELQMVLTDKNIQGRSIELMQFNQLREVKQCHILFINRVEQERLHTILPQLNDLPVLTVSDIADFTSQGGMIEFYVSSNQTLRFAVALKRVQDVGIQAATRLLRVAKIVTTE